jgi:hypothetical protein
MPAALALDHDVVAELVLEVFDRAAVHRIQVRYVGHVVEHFLRMQPIVPIWSIFQRTHCGSFHSAKSGTS